MDEDSKKLQSIGYILLYILAIILITVAFGFAGFIISIFATISIGLIIVGILGIKGNLKTSISINNAIKELPLNNENLLKNEAYTSGNLHMEKYYPEDKAAIEKFLMKYDLSDVDSILNIPVPNLKRQQLPTNVPTEPEQILQRQATYYKKVGKFDLAIACLKKSNEFMLTSFYSYHIKNYMRLVDFMYYNSQFEEAREERKKIYDYFGKDEVGELIELMNTLPTQEERNAYYKRLIIPEKEKMKDKEEYWWLLENLPQNAPKSFGGYRRMKSENTDKFIELRYLAKKKNFEI